MKPAHLLTAVLISAGGAQVAGAATTNLRPYELQPSDVGGARPTYDRPQVGIPTIFRAAATRRFAAARAGEGNFRLSQDVYLATSPVAANAVYGQLLRVELPKTLRSIAASTKLTRAVQKPWKVSLKGQSAGRVIDGTTTEARTGLPKGSRVRFYVVAIRVGSALTVVTALPNKGFDLAGEAGLQTILARAAARVTPLGAKRS